MLSFRFKENDFWLPITMQQWETLVNEMLPPLNKIAGGLTEDGEKGSFKGEYVSQIVMSAIHALDHKNGKWSKSALLEACVNRISCHVTYHAVQEVQKKLKAEQEASQPADVTSEQSEEQTN